MNIGNLAVQRLAVQYTIRFLEPLGGGMPFANEQRGTLIEVLYPLLHNKQSFTQFIKLFMCLRALSNSTIIVKCPLSDGK